MHGKMTILRILKIILACNSLVLGLGEERKEFSLKGRINPPLICSSGGSSTSLRYKSGSAPYSTESRQYNRASLKSGTSQNLHGYSAEEAEEESDLSEEEMSQTDARRPITKGLSQPTIKSSVTANQLAVSNSGQIDVVVESRSKPPVRSSAAQAVQRQSAAKEPPPGAVQWVITQKMKRELIQELDYLPSEVDQMDPQVASVVLRKGLRRPASGMPVSWKRSRRSNHPDPRSKPTQYVEIPMKSIVLAPIRVLKFAVLLPFRTIDMALMPLARISGPLHYVTKVTATVAILVAVGLVWSGKLEISPENMKDASNIFLTSCGKLLSYCSILPRKCSSVAGQLISLLIKIGSKISERLQLHKNNRFTKPSPEIIAEEVVPIDVDTESIVTDTWLDSVLDNVLQKK